MAKALRQNWCDEHYWDLVFLSAVQISTTWPVSASTSSTISPQYNFLLSSLALKQTTRGCCNACWLWFPNYLPSFFIHQLTASVRVVSTSLLNWTLSLGGQNAPDEDVKRKFLLHNVTLDALLKNGDQVRLIVTAIIFSQVFEKNAEVLVKIRKRYVCYTKRTTQLPLATGVESLPV